MNFEQLRDIIKNIKETVLCASCEANYGGQDIYILSTIADKCVLLVNCRHCHTPMLITASVNGTKNGQSVNEIEKMKFEHGKSEDIISSDDVLEIHDFLKDFDGDFQKLIVKEKREK